MKRRHLQVADLVGVLDPGEFSTVEIENRRTQTLLFHRVGTGSLTEEGACRVREVQFDDGLLRIVCE